MRLGLLVILLALATSVLAQDKPAWQGIPFGATDEQIARAALHTEKLPSREKFGEDKQYVERVIKGYEIVGARFHVSFAMGDTTNRLEEVYMTTSVEDDRDAKRLFDKLAQALSEKYGPHAFENARPRPLPTFEKSWRAGNLAIRLVALVAGKIVILTYKPTDGGNASKL